jgi:multidrug resistance efflux pump
VSDSDRLLSTTPAELGSVAISTSPNLIFYVLSGPCILQQVHAKRGDFIVKGEVLVTIESSVEKSAADTARFRSEAQGALLLARGKVAAAREKTRRRNELLAEEFVSAQARDDAAAELKLAEAEQRTAEENIDLARLEHRQSIDQLNRRVLRSPFNGMVSTRPLSGRPGRQRRQQEALPEDRADSAADRASHRAV